MPDAPAWIFLIGRILFILFPLNSGVTFHIPKGAMAVGYARQVKFPLAFLAGWPAGVWLAAGSLSVALGAWADVGSLMLGIFVVLAALGFHRFWEVEDQQQRTTQMQLFFRNVIILGASLILFAVFSTIGYGLPLTLTDPLFDLR